MSTVESESRGALESDSEHGASSENSVDTETPLSATFSSDLLKSALKRAARKTYSVSWDETLSSAPKHSCLQLAEALLGCRSKSPCWTYLNFVNTEGRPLGTGVLAVCKAWGIKAHPDAPKEMGFHIDRMEKPKSWSWSVFKRKVEICVQASEGSTSPLRILLYSCTLPRFVVAQLKEMLVKEVRTDDDPAKVNTDSPLLNWQKVEDPDDTEYVGDDYLQRVQELYTGWISCCDRIAQKVENLMLEDDSRKEDSNPVLLMRRWCNLASRGGKMELGKIIDEETFLHGRLSTVCTGHVTISWKARIELYKLALQSFPRFREKDTGFSVFVGSLADESANINDTQDLARAVQRLADSSGCSTVDEYLGLDQDGSSTGKRSHSTSSDIPHRTHHNESKRPRTGEGKNRAPSRELASVKLGLPADLIKTRFDAGLCLRCGHTGHKVRDCPNAVSGSPGASVSSASEYPKRDVALLSLDSRTGKVSPQTLLTVPVRLINPHSVKGDSVPALAGLDTMSSVNLVESSLVRKLQCDLSDCPSHIRTVNGSVTAEASTFITVCLSGYIAELPFVVVSGLPRVDLLVGHSWLPQLGVTFSIPKPHSEEGELRVRDLYSPVTDQIRAAEESLVGRLGDIHALPGAPHYFGRLRRARTIANGEERADRLDDPRQSMVYEVWCDTSSVANHRQKPKSGHNVPFPPADFSKPLIGKLSVGQQAQFRAELQTFIDKGWWAEVPPSVAPELLRERYDQTQSPFRYPAVSFPIIQKAHKSTRCRLVTDCRQCNQFLAPASYEGFSVTDCISLIRANWRDCYALGFLDLSKAFYKVHLGDDGRLLILADGRTFECSRLAFGLVHGPASLSGQVLVLLNASFSGLMGRPINCTSTRAFVGLLPGLFVIPYYDDIIIFGLPHMCQRMAHILTSIAPLIGACFPEDKTDWVDSNKGVFRHLGCLWSRGTLGELYIQCPPAEEDSLTLDSPFSRRRIFQIAGARYDGIRLHPVARLVADKLRRWAGTSPYGNSRKGWDHKWTLPDRSLDSLRSLIAQGESDNFGHCQHTGVPPHHRHIFGFCDASDEGWGFLAYTGVLVPRTFPPDLSESNPAFHLLEACAGEWSPSNGSSKWHINRKEAHALFRCLECIYEWLNRFLDATSRFDSITVFCDNTSALSWALKTGPAARTYDRVALERLTGSLAELREAISQKFGVVVELRHISGLHNYLADQLSRHPSLGIPLPSLGSDDGCEAQSANEALGSHTSAEERPAAFTFLVVTDTEEAATVFDRGSSHKYALVEPLDLCLSSEEVHNGVTLLISSPSSENGGEVSHIEDSLNQLRPHDPAELRGIGDMSEEDILSHVSDVLRDSIRASEAKIANVPVTEILASLRAPHTQVAHSGFPEPSEASENLVQGSGHGPYLRWDSENGVLLVSDPMEKAPRWRIFLPDRRSRMWALYQSHEHPLQSAHQGIDKALHSLRHPSERPAYWWPSMVRDVTQFIRSCKTCQMSRHYDLQNSQPLIRRRWRGRFECVQLDFMQLTDKQTAHPSPLGNSFFGVIVDEGTTVLRVTPTRSTSVQDAIGTILDWVATYGPPRVVQCDRAASHASTEFELFLRSWGVSLKLGLPRRPQCQGLVERLIGEMKKVCRLSPQLPPWAAIHTAVAVHNNSLISTTTVCTPNELALGLSCPLSLPPLPGGPSGQKGGEIAPHIHDYINLVYSVFTLSRSERALNAEMVSAARHQPKFAFRCGDTVRLSRWINGRRETTGPYTILKQDEGNSLLYHLVGRDSPAPVSQLLPYIADIHRDAFDYAVRPSQDRLAVIIKDKLPGGVDPADLQDGVHWLLFSVDDTENDELVKRIYVAKFLHHSNRRGALVVQGLDRQADGSWKLPPRDERTSTQSTIAEESILGGRGFLPSRGGWRIPRPVKVWFNSCGVNL